MARQTELEVEVIPHEYDRSDISPKEFLLAIMRDPRLPIAVRMDAAAKVAVYEHARLAQMTQDITAGIKIIIEGGLPALPGTNIIMPPHETPQTPAKGNGHDTA
jgi:hypothetical protein